MEQPKQQQQPGFFDLLSDRMQSPLFQMGAGMFSAASNGDDIGSGILKGTQAAQQTQRQRMAMSAQQMQQQARQAAMAREAAQEQQAQARKQQFAQMTGQPIDGITPEQMQVLQFMGPEQGAPLLMKLMQNRNDPMAAAELAYKQAQTAKLRREMEGGGEAADYGLQTVMGRDANGNPVLLQPSKRGTAVQTQLPEGVTLDYGGKARETVMGKAQGEAAADLPSFERKSQQIINQIDALIKDPKLSGMTGYSAYLPNVSPSSQGTQARMDQVTGKAFVQAFQDMKGAGAITELEGAKAAAALTRLQNPYQSDSDYRAALEEFKQEVQSMADTVRSRASGIRTPQQQGGGGGWSIQRVP